MKSRSMFLALSIGLAAFSATSAIAHHSNSAFETQKINEVSGTVTDWQWSNPHTWIYLDADDGKGGKVKWALEGRAPGVLARAGWTPKIIKVGDTVKVHYSPAKDGTNSGLIARVTLADGTILANNAPAVE
jgi:Family of unknown function (DUF6152)